MGSMILAQVADLDEPWNYIIFGVLNSPAVLVAIWFASMLYRRKFALRELLAFVPLSIVAIWWTVWLFKH